jgi:hypothetical protein
MARPKNHVKHIQEAADRLMRAVRELVASGAKAAGQAAPAARGSRKPGRPSSEALRVAQKKYWASMTPRQHAERVRKMLAGRGLKPKRKA